MLVSVTTGALLEVGLFVNSPDSADKEPSISPEYQSASDLRCRLAGDISCALGQNLMYHRLTLTFCIQVDY